MGQVICHLIDANGATPFFTSIARRHDRDRFPVMVGSISPVGSLQESMDALGVATFSLGVTSRWQYPVAITRLARLLRKNGVGVLHAHCFDPTLVGLLAARLASVPFVFTRHHSDHNIRLGKKWHTKVDSYCARNADQVIAVSDATRRILTEIEGVPEDIIRVVHNGMEPLREVTSEAAEKVRQEVGLGGERVCLIVGRLHEEKGHRFLFRALPSIIERTGPLTVLVAGTGPHRPEIEASAREAGVADRVRFLGRRDDIPELMSIASVVAMPSLAESFGFVALEAMSAGKAVVAADTGGLSEVVKHMESGLIVPAANSDALAEAICQVLSDESLARSLGEAGRRQAAWFSFDRMIRGYESVYDYHVTRRGWNNVENRTGTIQSEKNPR